MPYKVLVASRQAEKSTTTCNILCSQLLYNNNDSATYATAQIRQVQEFSNRKINFQFNSNPELKRRFLGKGSTNNIYDKQLSNGSILHLRAIGQNADSARGIISRGVIIDETQSIISDSIPVVMEITQSFPDYSYYIITGTPLTRSNILSKYYANSLQYEWLIKCPHCNRQNPPLGIDHIDSKKPYLFCIFCGKEMNAQHGRWIPQNPGAQYPGFRICRLMTPTARWHTNAQDGILDKFDGPNAYPIYRFLNEVLGLPAETGIVPISKEILYSIAADFDMIDPENPPEWIIKTRSVGTIDWAWNNKAGGQSYTIFALWVLINNIITNIYTKRFVGPAYHDPESVLNEIARHAKKTSTALIGTDYGIGHFENLRLRPKVEPIAVYEIMYAGHYNRLDYNSAENCYHIGRTESLDHVFAGLHSGLFAVPKLEQSKSYLDDILNVFTETDPTYRRVKYDHDDPDDFLHLLNYALLIFKKMRAY